VCSATALYTVGHSTRGLEEFLALLEHYHIRNLIDIRRFPTSSKYPHFRKEILAESLKKNGIAYYWLGDTLGGYRKGGYEAHVATEEFRRGIDEVKKIAGEGRTALMCAELLWFRCHRRYVADVLTREGNEVKHILDSERVNIHTLKV
jgi:uncharacterized protein (DUF488 family)